ncbi:MAG TPA: sensor histidine kinase [Armatimonadota bacterium]|jgi:signal transduction histidine kinase
MDTGRRIDKIFLLHIWACVPFAPLWLLGGTESHMTPSSDTMHIVVGVVGAYLLFRTWVVLRGGELAKWALLWCVMDSLIVTGILIGLHDAEDPTGFIYFLAVAYAGLRLSVKQVILVTLLSVLGQFGAGLLSHTWDKYFIDGNYMYVGFRHFFIILVASLITFLRRESQKVARQLAVSEYQSDLSAEMHDGIQHDLVLIARRLDLAEAVSETDPLRAASIAVEQRETARRASDELRFLIRQTRPDSLSPTDFMDALRQHLVTLSERFSIRIDFGYDGPPCEFPAAYQHNVLRIVQEAVTNAVKHAEASRITVRIRRGGRYYHIRVCDDGIGFSDGANGGSGFGLASLRARAESLGGSTRIVDRARSGAVIVARLPIQPPDRKAWFHGLHSRAAH